MDPKLLYHLCEVIEQGSLSRAAISLDITQPTLTRSIKSIESIVGASVLERGRYGVSPTDIGERLAEHGRNILNAMSAADAAVQHWQTGLVGVVRLGIGHMHSATLLPGFLAAHPMNESNFTLKVVTANSPDLLQKLRKGDLDMAIMPVTGQQSWQSLVRIELFSDQACILAGSNSPLLKIEADLAITQLAAQSWVAINTVPRIRHIHSEFLYRLGLENLVPKFSFDGDVTAPIELLRNSSMLTVVPRKLAEKYIDDGGLEILNTGIDLPNLKVALWFTNENQHDLSVQEMTKKITSYFREDIDEIATNATELTIAKLRSTL